MVVDSKTENGDKGLFIFFFSSDKNMVNTLTTSPLQLATRLSRTFGERIDSVIDQLRTQIKTQIQGRIPGEENVHRLERSKQIRKLRTELNKIRDRFDAHNDTLNLLRTDLEETARERQDETQQQRQFRQAQLSEIVHSHIRPYLKKIRHATKKLETFLQPRQGPPQPIEEQLKTIRAVVDELGPVPIFQTFRSFATRTGGKVITTGMKKTGEVWQGVKSYAKTGKRKTGQLWEVTKSYASSGKRKVGQVYDWASVLFSENISKPLRTSLRKFLKEIALEDSDRPAVIEQKLKNGLQRLKKNPEQNATMIAHIQEKLKQIERPAREARIAKRLRQIRAMPPPPPLFVPIGGGNLSERLQHIHSRVARAEATPPIPVQAVKTAPRQKRPRSF